MEEQSILNGGIDELNAIQEKLEKRDSIKEEIENVIIRTGKLEGDVSFAEKETQDIIDSTVKKRMSEVSASFDKEINDEKGKLRAARSKRGKAKNKGIKRRMDAETEELRKNVRDLKTDIKTVFKAKGVPGFCNTGYYYSMYCPKSLHDWIVLACTVVICILAVPMALYFVLDWFWLWKALFILGVIAVFIAVYVTIWLSTKDRFEATIVEMRGKRDAININKKEIRKIKNSIRKDKDESRYNLEDFDEEIREIESRIKVTADKKRQALEEFDKKTKPAIISEITGRNREKIEAMRKELGELTGRRRALESEAKDIAYEITSSYEAFLGAEYMAPGRIEELKSVIQSGNASTIIEAVNYIKEHQ